MQKNNSLLFSTITVLLMIILVSCGQKKSTETTITEETPAATSNVNCALWKSNQTFMAASYGLTHNEGSKIYINKLSIMQLVNSLKLESDPKLEEVKQALLDSIDHAPRTTDPLYTMEFRQPVIALRDRIAIGISNYIDQCPQ
jgi:hypothetical protein